ncbi:hypothetical protein QBC40DRAFT_346246 [Triangularia verruculosa]|uniref:Rhodopsin domain-containing protein n=1 Tax=Triangularia verruculosa TaxID=2587418 RepID=A0AAN6XQ66_9PEZI|nr:hypothetical protein QBC40DRAFT_346246 [Triangularia verruculosa]
MEPPVIDYGDPALLPHDDAGPQLLAVGWTLWCMAGLFLGTRIYCKLIGSRRLWWDDHFLIASQIIHLVATCLMTALMTDTGYGKHPWDKPGVSPIPSIKELLLMMTRATLTITAMSWSKTAFAITMLRFVDGWTRWGVWFIIISMNIAFGLTAMVPWLLCTPIHRTWDLSAEGTCHPFNVSVVLAYVSGAYSAFCDLLLALLPWMIISKLHMRTKEKMGVGIAMSMGFMSVFFLLSLPSAFTKRSLTYLHCYSAAIMAILKTVSLQNLLKMDSFYTAQLNIYDTAEISVTIMAASIPAMRVLFNEVRTSVRTQERQYYHSTTPQYGANRSGVVTTVKVEGNREEERPAGGDDKSDRRILGSDSGRDPGRICCVDEVEVTSTYSHGKRSMSDEEGGYEMKETVRKGSIPE